MSDHASNIAFTITLRIMSDSLDPTAVTAALMLEPTVSFRAGERVRETGLAAQLTRKHGYWSYSQQGVDREALSDAIVELAQRIPVSTLAHDAIRGCEIDMWVSSLDMRGANNGFQLNTDALRALADRGWTLVLDLYFENDKQS